jgi:hypothetical protein
LIAHIGGDDRDPVETDRSQPNPRRVWMPHSDTYSHPFGGQAMHESPTEKTRTAEDHNRGHHLLGHAALPMTPTLASIRISSRD